MTMRVFSGTCMCHLLPWESTTLLKLLIDKYTTQTMLIVTMLIVSMLIVTTLIATALIAITLITMAMAYCIVA